MNDGAVEESQKCDPIPHTLTSLGWGVLPLLSVLGSWARAFSHQHAQEYRLVLMIFHLRHLGLVYPGIVFYSFINFSKARHISSLIFSHCIVPYINHISISSPQWAELKMDEHFFNHSMFEGLIVWFSYCCHQPEMKERLNWSNSSISLHNQSSVARKKIFKSKLVFPTP